MQRTNPPQTTNTSTVRDAAVQIDAETRSTWLHYGLMKEHAGQSNDHVYPVALGQLLALTTMLTSCSKFDRTYAKREIRRLIALGKEIQP